MSFIADFHIHSKYSRATSPDMDIEHLAQSAQRKGIKLMGTGDFTHPGWLSELKTKLKSQNNGLFKYDQTYFILTTEVSNIYTKGGKGRRIHNMIFAPDFAAIEKINKELPKYGTLTSDGRPMLGLDAKNLLEIVLKASDDCLLVPGHIWTPWYSLFGSNSGFDDIKECFEDLTKYIYALETGLSSDPAMNWRLSKLDRFTLISNSDSHSPAKIGREANLLNCELDYSSVIQTLRTKDKNKFVKTLEFFPEEGKYHYDGHRNCKVLLSPKEAKINRNICPVCGGQVTIGVMHRVEDLADRAEGYVPTNVIDFINLIPLAEIIADVLNVGEATSTVQKEYEKFLQNFGTEFNILMNIPFDDLQKINAKVAQGIIAVRERKVNITPGYDGEYGKISIALSGEKETTQLSLF